MKKLLCLMGGAMLFIQANSQGPQAVPIGTQVPEMTFENVINYPKDHFKLSDFRGKLVIIDFFGTWCTSCMPLIPKLDSFQKQFKDSLQVIVICSDNSIEKVQTFIEKKWGKNKLTIPFVLMDSIHKNMFPHIMIPHEVWITPDGKLLATTGDEPVTEKNIRSVLHNEPVNLPIKTEQVNFKEDQPLLFNNNGGSVKDILFQSLFTRFLKGVPGFTSVEVDSINHTKRYVYTNRIILSLYRFATHMGSERLILETTDSSRFYFKKTPGASRDAWWDKNSFSYELTVPDTTSNSTVQRIMLEDLNRYLGLYGRIEKRKTKCWSLVRIAGMPCLIQDTSMQTTPKADKVFKWHNKPAASLAPLLQSPRTPIVVDDTGIKGTVSIEISNKAFKDLALLKKELNALGLDLIPAEKAIDMLVITDLCNQ